MGSVWLHDLPEILGATPLDVLWWSGWETRSRSSGGYDKILAVQCHHDASSKSWTLEQGMAAASSPNNPDRPVGALWLGRDGRVGVLAAGATNTSGRGWSLTCSKGIIPVDAANRYVIAIEAMNNGAGEVWPDDQLEAYRILCAALIDGYGLDPDARWADLHAHYEYTDRKIDPAGPPYATPGDPWLRWDMIQFRADVKATTPTPGAPPMATLPAPIPILDTRIKNLPLKGKRADGTFVPRRVGILEPPAWAGAVRIHLTSDGAVAPGWLSTDGGVSSKLNYQAEQAIGGEVSVPLKRDAAGWYIEVTSLVQSHILVAIVGWDSVL